MNVKFYANRPDLVREYILGSVEAGKYTGWEIIEFNSQPTLTFSQYKYRVHNADTSVLVSLYFKPDDKVTIDEKKEGINYFITIIGQDLINRSMIQENYVIDDRQ